MKFQIGLVTIEKNPHLKEVITVYVNYELWDDEDKSFEGKYGLATFNFEHKAKALEVAKTLSSKYRKNDTFIKTIQHYAIMTHLTGAGFYDKHMKLFNKFHAKLIKDLARNLGIGK